MMACGLCRHGVNCRIIDALPGPANQCKAIGIQPRTLEVWEDLGIATDAVNAGLWLRGMRGFVNGQQTTELLLDLPDAPYGFLALPQYETERILTMHLNRLGTVIERNAVLKSFRQNEDEVIAEVTIADRPPEQIQCRYLVGCDGAHSTVRRRLGLPFEGDRYADRYMLGDVEMQWDLPHGWSYRFLHVAEDKMDDLLVCIPIPGKNRYRLSMLAASELVAAQRSIDHGLTADGPKPTLAHIQAVVDRLAPPGTKVDALRWSSLFGLSHRIVPRYNVDQVFLAGDAAHIHPPTGAQGMNTGIQDAYNLAWKLALVVKGVAHPRLLESYDAERRPVGEEVLGRTHQQAEAQRRGETDTARDRLMKEAQLLVNYRDSPWVAQDLATANAQDQGPRPGDRAPDVLGLRRDGLGFPLRLFDVLRGTAHVLLLYVDSGESNVIAAGADIAASVRARYGTLIRSYMIVDERAHSSAHEGLSVLRDPEGGFRQAYGVTAACAYLIRPDSYIAYRCAPVRSDCLTKYLERIFS
jgi:2-polyprenyl-6-methoxyphenol hydroxylase-like FAD-dependent oxidoreductase